ncbi:dihydroorotase [Elizabethkingia anophelis]|uniref:Dihydroorotase n=2 Tax=Bacteroidota TaxID=976 RepID=A0ACD5C716_9SPHI|nr:MULTISPECIES: dihydroorotase [Flavobacteriales]OJU76778.1 MAG: dihydroorotase [Bacteroidetes bacterium 47-18]MDV3875050.1 dihydroorotase [Elizabethkingia anophelis]MDV3892882.1 dihydroorotase [Elizabethkingia anophelis]MDV3916443.1 dihydroorotase [Elizabethkingia anophelis]MDV3919379.1 dihydroorotase [Elizabethkingia anophelis]
MTQPILIKDTNVVNEGIITNADVLIANGRIQKIGIALHQWDAKVISGNGKYLFPGVIDGQVHFRDPGLTHKADLYTESKAAIAGGVTSFIDMPNTKPNVLTLKLWENKYRMAAQKSLANFGFFMGVNADNIEDILQMDTSQFLAVSDDGLYFTKKGNLLADNPQVMEKLFAHCQCIIAVHAEKEALITANEAVYKLQYGNDIPFKFHPQIRNEQACIEATRDFIALATKYNARLHILHLTTASEAQLFDKTIPLTDKNITTEVCVQHLWFSEKDYDRLGAFIKWNPSIKSEADRKGLLQALTDNHIDLVTTDHAPHTLEEKSGNYFTALSGAPMVQHSLNIMLEFFKQGIISLEKIAEKMCHNPAILYQIENRGFIREGYYADLVLVDMNREWMVSKDNILYKCGWSPLEGTVFQTKVTHTLVNGNLVYEEGHFNEDRKGKALVKHNT